MIWVDGLSLKWAAIDALDSVKSRPSQLSCKQDCCAVTRLSQLSQKLNHVRSLKSVLESGTGADAVTCCVQASTSVQTSRWLVCQQCFGLLRSALATGGLLWRSLVKSLQTAQANSREHAAPPLPMHRRVPSGAVHRPTLSVSHERNCRTVPPWRSKEHSGVDPSKYFQ